MPTNSRGVLTNGTQLIYAINKFRKKRALDESNSDLRQEGCPRNDATGSAPTPQSA